MHVSDFDRSANRAGIIGTKVLAGQKLCLPPWLFRVKFSEMGSCSGKDCIRLLRPVIVLCAFSICRASAQSSPPTEAESADGLLGPAETAIIDVRNYGIDFDQPEGPSIVYPVFFTALEFDHNGNRVMAGEILPNGNFFGEIITNIRDPGGHITQRIYTDFASGKLSHEDWFGPYGILRSDTYIRGELFQRQLCTYEEQGRMSTCTTQDAKGTVIEARVMKTANDGQVVKESTVGHEAGELFDEEIDNKNNSHLFERFDENGKPELQSSIRQGKVDSFWAASNKGNQWGSNSTNFTNPSDASRTSCTNNGCTTSHIHYEFVDKAKRQPLSAEWKDANDKLIYAAYYEYVFDSHGNWVRREVWIISPSHPNRTFYETDMRTITYWNR